MKILNVELQDYLLSTIISIKLPMKRDIIFIGEF